MSITSFYLCVLVTFWTKEIRLEKWIVTQFVQKTSMSEIVNYNYDKNKYYRGTTHYTGDDTGVFFFEPVRRIENY